MSVYIRRWNTERETTPQGRTQSFYCSVCFTKLYPGLVSLIEECPDEWYTSWSTGHKYRRVKRGEKVDTSHCAACGGNIL